MESFHRRHLPHYDVGCGTYFVTTCLVGSIPAVGTASLRRQSEMRRRLPRPAGLSTAMWKQRIGFDAFAASEVWLDAHPAVYWLADTRLAAVVRDELMRESGRCYDLHAFVVMPSHVHMLFTPLRQWVEKQAAAGLSGGPRTSIMRAFKGRTSISCNRILKRRGAFWQSESYDRVVRDERAFENVVRYIEGNPVKAGLCDIPEGWEFSSASRTLEEARSRHV
jgi:REP element-mobilizing transposase RayT